MVNVTSFSRIIFFVNFSASYFHKKRIIIITSHRRFSVRHSCDVCSRSSWNGGVRWGCRRKYFFLLLFFRNEEFSNFYATVFRFISPLHSFTSNFVEYFPGIFFATATGTRIFFNNTKRRETFRRITISITYNVRVPTAIAV